MRKFKRILSFFLTVIIILSCFSVSMITASAAEIDSSTGSGTSTVEYSVDPGWTATIPAYIKAADQGQQNASDYTVTIRDVLLGDMQKLVATIDYDGVLSESNGIQLKYSLYDSDGRIEPEKRFAEIPAGDPDEEYTYTFGAALDEKPKYAGNYLGTVTFNISVEDIFYTAEEIEKNPLLYPIGKTVPEYVVAEFNEDYSAVTVFKNGADSDGIMMGWSFGASPFYKNRTFVTAEIKGNVKNIGSAAFQYCENLESLIIGNGVESIDDEWTFSNCTSLKNVTIPDSVEYIGYAAFFYCTSLADVSIGKNVKTIRAGALNYTAITSVTIPDSVSTLGGGGLGGDGGDVFADCHSLKEVNIGSGVQNLPEQIFLNCYSLTEITIPENVKSIEKDAFCECTSLCEITFEGKETVIDNGAFFRVPNDMVIYGHAGSDAETFAQAKGYTFIAL